MWTSNSSVPRDVQWAPDKWIWKKIKNVHTHTPLFHIYSGCTHDEQGERKAVIQGGPS